jgi:hypothetical protein
MYSEELYINIERIEHAKYPFQLIFFEYQYLDN